MSIVSSLLLIIYTTIFQSKASNYPCRWETKNATFDLCRLQLTTSTENQDNRAYYEVFDDRVDAFFNFTYIFNVCNDIESRPPDEICYNNTLRDRPDKMMPIGYCSERNETEGAYNECIEITPITANVAAYQIDRSKHSNQVHDCYRLHNGIDAPLFSYIDSTDPSIGVKLTYINGDWCEVANMNREFSLMFYCTENTENIPDKREEIIQEDETCSYVLNISTSYGCPTECPMSSNNKLCDGHGICDFDFTNNKPQCYCYYGYCGADCSSEHCDASGQQLYNITAPNDDKSCLFELTDSFGIKAYYDLSDFNLENENFIVDDYNDREYVYKFNICGNLENFDNETKIPKSCTNYNHGPCTYFVNSNDTLKNVTVVTSHCGAYDQYDTYDSNSVAKAVQIFYPKSNKSDPACYWLGMDLPVGFNMLSYGIELIDANDSGKGVIFKIMNGQYCDEGARNRELNIKLECPHTSGYEFDPYEEAQKIKNESIFESDMCIYEIEWKSPLACPFNCISKGVGQNANKYSVCSSHGICASDPQAQQIRCICDAGYTGIVCEKKSSAISTTKSGGNGNSGGNNGLSIGLGVSISLLVLIVAGGFFYLQRKKKIALGQISGYIQGDGLIQGQSGVEAGQ